MRYLKEHQLIRGLVPTKLYITDTDIVSQSKSQLEKYTQYSITEITAPVWQLCDSRHDNPIANQGGLFPRCLMSPMDTEGLQKQLEYKLDGLYNFPDTLFCVATGMSTALLALVNACANMNIRLCVLHYDVVHDCYKAQFIKNFYWDEMFARQFTYDDSDGIIKVVEK